MLDDYLMTMWVPIFSSIVESSLWDEDDSLCKVFITMLALKGKDNVYRGTAYGLARQTRKVEEEIVRILDILESPDRRRMEQQEFEGRRIQKVEGGWLILNGMKYQKVMSDAMKRARWAKAQAKAREKKAIAAGKAREKRAIKNNGEHHERFTGDIRQGEDCEDASSCD